MGYQDAGDRTMWYLQHQQAREIMAAREREAASLRLAREYRAGTAGKAGQRAGLRRRLAALAASGSRFAARVATALDPGAFDGGAASTS